VDDQINNREGDGVLTPRSLFAVALAYLGVSYLSGCASAVLAIITGPFSTLIIGGMLLFVALLIYRGGGKQ
jgi:hypothetical protein